MALVPAVERASDALEFDVATELLDELSTPTRDGQQATPAEDDDPAPF